MLKTIESVIILFWNAVNYHMYHLIKQPTSYNDDLAHELYRMAEKAVQV